MSINATDATERAINLEKMHGLKLNKAQKLVFASALAGQRAIKAQKQRLNSVNPTHSTKTHSSRGPK